MKTRAVLSLSLSALMLGGSVVACSHGQGLASASARDADKAQRQAADLADKAGRQIAHRNGDKAVEYAEAAVALQPRDAGYRALLGQSYLQAGRFASAHQAFADTLALDPANAKAALNLALAETAEGDWTAARATLTRYADIIPASDRGLALALAGDPKGAVAVLLPAARTPGADAKTRQNLALAMALGGDWRDARVIVGMDLTPAKVDERLGEWAQFTHPTNASQQVATLLGVKPSQDPGQPVALALNAPATNVALADATAPAAPVAEPAPAVEAAPAAKPAPVEVAAAEVAAAPHVVFAARHEVVQALPTANALPSAKTAPAFAYASARATKPAAAPQALAAGNYYVQFGAFENAAVARDGWVRATRRLPALAQQTPQGMSFSQNGTTYYRLSAGGFSKADARRLCSQYQAHGGRCFVRTDAGDQVAQWVKRGTELASR
ncbi:MAG: SPOR domain-containing protein [Sphingomonas sp.]